MYTMSTPPPLLHLVTQRAEGAARIEDVNTTWGVDAACIGAAVMHLHRYEVCAASVRISMRTLEATI